MIECVIIDDNPMARTALRNLVRQVKSLELIGECESAMDAYGFLQRKKADLLLLDVEMPDMSGLELLRSLDNPPAVILITSKSDYAVDAFGLKVLDYIVKPVTLARLLQAVDRLAESRHTARSAEHAGYIFVREENTLVRIDLEDILYLEAMGDYVRIATPQKKHTVHQTMKNLLDKLPADRFFRCHRSYIIAPDKIESIADNMIVINKDVIPLSETNKKELMDRINLI
ncbi:MAG TPA: LytTR family DNA-binding domain-containing protein [Flavilitoribacter sp.]|nr:LytTR family DNA-binding domain-containing protein [Flavilitoribacter sp.]